MYIDRENQVIQNFELDAFRTNRIINKTHSKDEIIKSIFSIFFIIQARSTITTLVDLLIAGITLAAAIFAALTLIAIAIPTTAVTAAPPAAEPAINPILAVGSLLFSTFLQMFVS